MSSTPVIVGAALSDVGVTNRSPLQLHAQAARRALEDSGLTLSDIDGICTSDIDGEYAPAVRLGEYLGITPTYFDSTALGGAGFISQVAHAALAVRHGLARVVLVSYARSPRSWVLPPSLSPAHIGPSLYERAWGAPFPVTAYALAARRYLEDYDVPVETLAQVAVSTRKWAQLNPEAFARDPLTVEQVLESRMIADPLHRLDCCLVTDGGASVIITDRERAKDLPQPPTVILGHAEASSHMSITSMPHLTRTAANYTGKVALQRANVEIEDIDVFQLYDSFTITVLLTMESLGLCSPGEAGFVFISGRTSPGGDLPINTNGGGLSFGHPGEYGAFTVVESVRQLRGQCGPRQVAGAELALAHGTGGELSVTSTLVLGRER